MNPAAIPQQVTLRYIGHLIRHGENRDGIELVHLLRREAEHDGIVIGHYYEAVILLLKAQSESAAGVTPYQAVQRALSKIGVTFR
jgi:hypothetical protein